MATVKDLIKQYQEDPEVKKEVKAIISDGKVSIAEFMDFAKKYDLEVSLSDIAELVEKLKKLG